MLFSSLQYLFFLALLFLIYYLLVPARFRWVLLLMASIYFYYTWNGYFLVIVGASILVDYFAGLLMFEESEKGRRKAYLLLSITSNIGLLFAFKYLGFVLENINAMLSLFGAETQLAIRGFPFPIGISFYTFQTLSYTIDIFKGYRKPEKNMGKFALYVLFFPQLLAGPIERSRTLLPQLNQLSSFKYDNAVAGLRFILWGAFKKIVVADRMGEYIDMVYRSPAEYQGLPLIWGSCLFTLQIYCDFSGYTDMAIGSARIFGVNLSKNFENRVYFTATRADFWKGWHITLTEWFRDYLFFTVVGRSRSTVRFYASLAFVFIITGVWHGAGWGFIIWGLINGLWVMAERASVDGRSHLISQLGLRKTPRLLFFISASFIFITNAFFSIWFKSETMEKSLEILQYSFLFTSPNWGFLISQDMLIIFVTFITMDILNVRMGDRLIDEYLGSLVTWQRWTIYLFLIQLLLLFGLFQNNEFYYFRF